MNSSPSFRHDSTHGSANVQGHRDGRLHQSHPKELVRQQSEDVPLWVRLVEEIARTETDRARDIYHRGERVHSEVQMTPPRRSMRRYLSEPSLAIGCC